MEGYNQCINGNYYKNTLSVCPHCPQQNSGGIFDKTQINTESGSSAGGLFDKTQISGAGDYEQTLVNSGSKESANRDLSKTFIQESNDNTEGNTGTGQIRQARTLTGWLVSFTLDPMGLDFRLYEALNTIGRDPENTITINDDMSVSGKHVSILCKNGKFYIKDEMAANGTFINNVELEIGKSYDLNDGDEIRLGNTAFKFRSCHS